MAGWTTLTAYARTSTSTTSIQMFAQRLLACARWECAS